MTYEFKLPDLGEGVSEGEVLRWLVREGEVIGAEQPLVEVMTDKVTAEIPSPRAGTVLRIAVPEGAVVPVGTVLVTIGEAGAAAVLRDTGPSKPARDEEPARLGNGRSSAALAPPADVRVLAVPAVRKLARDLGVDLDQVPATGGRITLSDVRRFAEARQRPAAPASPPPEEPTLDGAPQVERVPLRGRRRRIAAHMLEAAQQTAPYTSVEEAELTDLAALRERLKPVAAARGARLTFLPFIITALVAAVKRYPRLNATVDRESGDMLIHREVHAGVAVDTSDGLIVPVIRNAGTRGILDLAREVERLAEAARGGTLAGTETQGGPFTITSLGARGGVLATPVINTPEVAILGVHKIAPRPVVREGQIVVRQVANLSLTFDHRYIDGGDGADFAAALIGYLQDPALLLFWLSELREEA